RVTCYSCFLLRCYFFCLFFFSSRRRHTRSKRDWSSDVCSSDLRTNSRNGRVDSVIAMQTTAAPVNSQRKIVSPLIRPASTTAGRSEERRVGKECRCGGWESQ